MVRAATDADAPRIADIYNHYVTETTITFEEVAVAADEILIRMRAVADANLPWLVAEVDGEVVGYAYAAPWRVRSAYRFSVETTVYLTPSALGQGLGRALYTELLDRLRRRGIHAAIGGITIPNPPSILLHERMGFAKVAQFPQVGFKFGRWLDVGYWQILL